MHVNVLMLLLNSILTFGYIMNFYLTSLVDSIDADSIASFPGIRDLEGALFQ